MGSYDVYCACCGGPFDYMVKVAGARRKKKRQRRSRRLAGSAPENKGASDPDPGESAGAGGESDESGDDDYEGEIGVNEDELLEHYDADIVDEDDVAWTRDVYVIGSAMEICEEPLGPAFISGPCSYDLYSAVTLREEAGEDPNFDSYNQCYEVGTDAMRVYPFHKPCLDILAWVLTGTPDRHRLSGDLDHLYMTLFNHPHHVCGLDLDYGKPPPQHDQIWVCRRGEEEVLVADPLPFSPPSSSSSSSSSSPKAQRVTKALRDHLLQMPVAKGGQEDGTGEGKGNDPFARLPVELLCNVAVEHLSARDIAALATASRAVNRALGREPGVWRAYVRKRMPWFRELYELLGEGGGGGGGGADGAEKKGGKEKSLVGLVCWADRETAGQKAWKPEDHHLIGVANRRRIWGVCEQFADSYF